MPVQGSFASPLHTFSVALGAAVAPKVPALKELTAAEELLIPLEWFFDDDGDEYELEEYEGEE